MEEARKIRQILKAQPVIEGAGVHLKRVFGSHEVPDLDPFLLLDDFHSDQPDKYSKGFPWHPHRGIETITYVLHGNVEHGDSMGNRGIISSGDVQWMTAGSGIVHQEMPKGDKNDLLWGFQLWANLPASHKMMHPRYQEINAEDIQTLVTAEGAFIKVIAGKLGEIEGPVRDIVIDPRFLDITLPENKTLHLQTEPDHKAFAYVIEGKGYFEPGTKSPAGVETIVIYEAGKSIAVSSGDAPVRFLLVSGKPINESISWQGPIVMNTDEELETAFREFRNGTFLKHQKK